MTLDGPNPSDWSLGAGLKGQGVVVTGAAGGIGRAVAFAFAAVGARVMAVDMDEGAVTEIAGALPGAGHFGVAADLRQLDSHGDLLAAAESRLGPVRALAHVAAVLRRRSDIDDVSEADWDLQIDTNLKATFFLCRAVADAMAARGGPGSVITFSSQGWWTGGFGGSVVYNAAKGGIVTLTRGLARVYGPSGVTCNSVAPGQVRTPMLLDALDPAVLKTMTESTPLGRVAEPEEIAPLVVFLASDHARFITGATINISGGMLMY